ncbi:uncharacterized protein DFL_006936 [Arthrobotrys flagrans]|uniref:Ecp2 effector protein domain-containing protein n=1 Tax=Arthrobotrys flagrans TaxID=97331 RepID=A0A436ZUJ0_ARTFL|nr:hypothetical protein DFL_006936 [Arthrobotrys flagrans]
MRGLIFLLSASQLLSQGQALAISSPEELLDREHYGIRIRDIIDHVYGKSPLQRRSEGEFVPECRPGSTPHYQNETLTACSFETSIESYNKAVRDIYTKCTRRSLDQGTPVYHFKRGGGLKFKKAGDGGYNGKYKINGGGHPVISDDDAPVAIPSIIPGDEFGPEDDMSLGRVDIQGNVDLPTNWTINRDDGGCYNSGTWAKLEEVGKIRVPWCQFLHKTRNIVAVRHLTFFKASLDPAKPGKLLRNSDNQIMAIHTEYVTRAFLPGDNNVFALCLNGTKTLLEGPCHGENDDTRGGWQVVRREAHADEEKNEDERSVSFGWDPTTGLECC